jgi:hypothetical protein
VRAGGWYWIKVREDGAWCAAFWNTVKERWFVMDDCLLPEEVHKVHETPLTPPEE